MSPIASSVHRVSVIFSVLLSLSHFELLDNVCGLVYGPLDLWQNKTYGLGFAVTLKCDLGKLSKYDFSVVRKFFLQNSGGANYYYFVLELLGLHEIIKTLRKISYFYILAILNDRLVIVVWIIPAL